MASSTVAAAAEDLAPSRTANEASSPSSSSEGEPTAAGDGRQHFGGSTPVPSYPFTADFHLEFQESRVEACQHFSRCHPDGTGAIVLFFPGVHGGVGPCRSPGKNFDDAALYPTLASKLVASHDVDCYRCSWPFMRPQMSYAVGGACRILHHSLLEAMKGYPEDAKPREFRIFFVGHSLGGAVAVQAAEVVARHFGIDGTGGAGQRMEGLERAIVRMWGICTLNGALDVRQHRGSFHSLRETHALLISGDADEVVPPRATDEFYKALPSKSKRQLVLPGGTHDLFNHKAQLVEEISEFISGHLVAAGGPDAQTVEASGER